MNEILWNFGLSGYEVFGFFLKSILSKNVFLSIEEYCGIYSVE